MGDAVLLMILSTGRVAEKKYLWKYLPWEIFLT